MPEHIGPASAAFDLRAVVRDVLERTQLADPGLIATEVERRIPRNRVVDVMRITLRQYVRVVITQERMGAGLDLPPVPSGRSAKRDAIREHWRKVLQRREFFGDTWKTLAECTTSDLLTLCAERRGEAQKLAAKADEYQRLADLVEQHGVDTVGELPETVLAEQLRDAA